MHLIGEIKGLQASKGGRKARRLLTTAVQLDVAVADMVVQGHELAGDVQLHRPWSYWLLAYPAAGA
jgi:hypothetical protein